jgi:hypothetical protein
MKTPPSGMSMMLKALGIDIDPNMIKNVAEAVTTVRDRMDAIDKRLERIEQKLDEVLNGRNSISVSSGDSGSANGSINRILGSGEHSTKD